MSSCDRGIDATLYMLNNSFRVRVLVREGEIVDNGFGEQRRRRAQKKTYKENAGGTKHLEGKIIMVWGGLFDLLLASVNRLFEMCLAWPRA